ncbi:MAG: D-alanyl-D-alanine carboxypeptidase, partial [Candidatus Eremiobacteraeota bacterium]|nr:D-alanyl-D-alanine carboxypeptidase [Candidatus Eremiobacteraeota bacterium]
HVLKAEGIAIDGTVKLLPEGSRPDLSGLETYARFRSPDLEKLMIQTNRRSDNLFAEHLFKSTAFDFKGFGSAANGEAAVKDFFLRHRIDSQGLHMVDGSGLSELDRISPRQLVGLLGVMWEHPNGQVFIDTLPAGGEGTMRYRLNDLVVRAKTGTLNNHSGLSGYVVSSYGQTLGFSILVNDVQATWPAVELQDYIVKMLTNWTQPL